MGAHAKAMHRAHYKRTLLAELMLVTEIQLLIFMAKWPSDPETTLILDGVLLLLGILGCAFLLARRTGGWFLLCGILPIVASLMQLFWSFGAETSFLVFVTVLLVADMVANLILLGISLWSESARPGWKGPRKR